MLDQGLLLVENRAVVDMHTCFLSALDMGS